MDKNSTIAELTNAFNIKVNALKQQLTNNINAINNSKANIKEKNNAIHALIVSYNNAINKLKIKLASDIKAIQTLTKINKNALLIGINYRGTSNELYGCINDTNNVKNLLDQFGYNKYVFLTDDTNKKPTKKNILEALTNLLVNSVSGDTLFFLYSGHGTCTTDVNKDELDGQDELIVPIDAYNISTCILDDELNNIIRKELKQGVNLFALFDSCFSGTVLDLKYNYLDNTNNLNTVINPNVPETSGQVIMISGCMDNQTSADAYVSYNGKNMGAGAMTFSFLKTIQQLGVNITIKTLIESMRGLLKDNGYEQIPQLSSGKEINIDKMLLPL